jgi:hypothetical protein
MEVAMRYLPACLILAVSFTGAGAQPSAGARSGIHLPEEARPPVLDRIGLPAGLTTLTISADGARAAAALEEDGEAARSTILLYSTGTDDPSSLELNGRVRDLLFSPDAQSVLCLLHRPAKRREGDTYLMSIELEPPRARRVMRLPPSARGLDYWPQREALLVASRNEVRTLTFPGLRSGPLYRVSGENLSVAFLGPGGLILLGQQNALLLVDLDAPPGEMEMPVRERVPASPAVVSLAAAADGSRALARLADGTVHGVELRPLRLAATGVPGPVASTEKVHGGTPADPEPTEPGAGDPPSAAPVPSDAGPPPPAAQKPPPAASAVPAPIVPGADPEPEEPQVRGRIAGPAASEVTAVVILGPDSILREALRVAPGEDGRWSADGLAPGRYRVQLDGGGARVIVAQPPFLLLEIHPGESIDAGEIRAVQAF